MYKKILILFIITAMMLTMYACSGEVSNGEDTDNGKVEKTKEEIYEGKKRLVWVTLESLYFGGPMDPEVLLEFNRMLDERGYDFVVDFKTIDYLHNAEIIHNLIAEGEQIDILFSGFAPNYLDFTNNGYYQPLNEYFHTEYGQILYSSHSPLSWKTVEIDGKYYGIDISQTPAYRKYLIFNKTLLEKHNMDVTRNLEDIWDLKDMLSTIYEQKYEKQNIFLCDTPPDLSVVGQHLAMHWMFHHMTPVVGVKFDDEEAKVVNIYEDPYTLKYFQTLKEFKDAGYITIVERNEGDIHRDPWYDYLSDNNFFVIERWGGPESFVREEIKYLYNIEDIVVVSLYDTYVTKVSTGVLNGVTAWSEYKEEALKVLALLSSDAELANLLTYGIEGKHYRLEDGHVKRLETDETYAPRELFFGNQLITYPKLNEPLTKENDLRAFNSQIKLSPIHGFLFDSGNVADEIKRTNELLYNYTFLLIGDVDDIYETFEQLNRELNQAGIDKIIEEVKRQLEEWQSSS